MPRVYHVLIPSRKIQELEDEAKALKRRLLSIAPTSPSESPILASSSSLQSRVLTQGNAAKFSTNALANELSLERPSRVNSDDPTESRSISGLDLGPSIIDDCFDL
jgi:hypothetical protein